MPEPTMVVEQVGPNGVSTKPVVVSFVRGGDPGPMLLEIRGVVPNVTTGAAILTYLQGVKVSPAQREAWAVKAQENGVANAPLQDGWRQKGTLRAKQMGPVMRALIEVAADKWGETPAAVRAAMRVKMDV